MGIHSVQFPQKSKLGNSHHVNLQNVGHEIHHMQKSKGLEYRGAIGNYLQVPVKARGNGKDQWMALIYPKSRSPIEE